MASEAMHIRAAATESHRVCREVTLAAAVDLVKDEQEKVWVDIVTQDTPEVRAILRDQFGFHELAIEDALSRNERPQLQQYGDSIFFAVAVLRPRENDSKENTYEEIGFFLGAHYLVTVASERFPELDSVFADWTRPNGRLSLGPSMVAHAILDRIMDAFFPALDAIEDQVEDAFDKLAVGSDTEMALIVRTKRDLAAMRRRLNPSRDVLNALLRLGEPELSPQAMPYFRDVLDHTLRLLEMIDETRDMVGSLLDVHLSQVSNSLNVVVKKMTVFSTVLMSMALIAGVYGQNFDHMPELHWQYGYLFSWVVMFTVGILVIFGFKIAKWL